ncbi:50S ribosome-binding GTPase, partial [Candidatus Microgenomates bacterium]|nr:50S ribosome-binding GTPase [Candidatus Microgenomates bacterium]
MLKVGIIGLPNVGKSTLFNALLKKQQALVANYPFATIEPNVGVVPVPDERLEVLADIIAGGPSTSGESSSATPEVSKRPPIKPATVEFVDIAGLVKGANEGAGLGNKFLSHIREVSIIAHVVRAFEDADIIKEGSVNPKSDYQTIETELMLADLQTLENSKLPTSLKLRETSKTQKEEVIEKLKSGLNNGKPVREIVLTDEEKKEASQ